MTTREKFLWVMIVVLLGSVVLSNLDTLTDRVHPIGVPCQYEFVGPMPV